MKRSVLFFMILMSVAVRAQDNGKYLEGAVPEIDGKVVFTKSLHIPSFSKDRMFETVSNWANERFKSVEGFGQGVVYSNKETGEIACRGDEYLVFSSSSFSLDRSRISYLLKMECGEGTCEISMSGIRYQYDVSYQKQPERYTAEEHITDKNALSKGKLNRGNGKFRVKTIDLKDELFTEITLLFSSSLVEKPVPVTASVVAEPEKPVQTVSTIPAAVASSPLAGYKQIIPEKIPGNIIKMLSEDWMLITSGNKEQFNMMTASWGGLGFLYQKPVAFCFINPARYTYQLMEKNDTYTLSFYTEAYRDALNICGTKSGRDTDKIKESGLTPIVTPSGNHAFSEAWMIIECKKLVSQSFIPEAVNDGALKESWTGKAMHKMYIGEIVNVWVK